MKGKIYIKSRVSGKTTDLLKKHLINYNNSCLIVMNERERKRILKQYRISPYNIFSVNGALYKKIGGIKKDILYIDEYLLFNEDQKQEIYNIVTLFNYVEVQTTPDKLYNKILIDIIKAIKSLNSTDILGLDVFDEYKDYFYNLLTHPNFEVVTFDCWQKHLTKEQFEIETQGKLYYNEGEY